VIAQLLFHSADDHSGLIDLVMLEPAVEFGQPRAGAPVSVVLDMEIGTAPSGAVETIDRWVAQMSLVSIQFEWIEGSEHLVFRDAAGDAVWFEVASP
jgi:hypothetical protein